MKLSKQDFLDYVSHVEKQITAIQNMMEEEWLDINIHTATAAITPYLYAYLNEAQEDSDVMFKGFAVMVRNYIKINRAIKRGDFARMNEAGDLEGIEDETIQRFTERNKYLQPSDDLTIIVVNYTGEPIMQILENQQQGTVVYHLLKEKKETNS
jgi:hypothetical protein